MTKISVLMSLYYKETAHNLEQCLESLANQTLPADEIVVVKDGTLTYALEKALLEWQEKLPLKIIGYTENKGLAYALNYGLQYCSHELVARMDSDDICMPDRFKKQVKYLEMNKDAVIVGTSLLEFYEGNL
jgi:glycosyltransferase involved in cell wall biosynthesis